MHQPEQFYKTEKKLFEKGLSSVKRKLTTFSTLRLFTFLATTIGIYFFFGNVQWDPFNFDNRYSGIHLFGCHT